MIRLDPMPSWWIWFLLNKVAEWSYSTAIELIPVNHCIKVVTTIGQNRGLKLIKFVWKYLLIRSAKSALSCTFKKWCDFYLNYLNLTVFSIVIGIVLASLNRSIGVQDFNLRSRLKIRVWLSLTWIWIIPFNITSNHNRPNQFHQVQNIHVVIFRNSQIIISQLEAHYTKSA